MFASYVPEQIVLRRNECAVSGVHCGTALDVSLLYTVLTYPNITRRRMKIFPGQPQWPIQSVWYVVAMYRTAE